MHEFNVGDRVFKYVYVSDGLYDKCVEKYGIVTSVVDTGIDVQFPDEEKPTFYSFKIFKASHDEYFDYIRHLKELNEKAWQAVSKCPNDERLRKTAVETYGKVEANERCFSS